MADKSGINYVSKSWSPWIGCSPVSEGCKNCYARREMTRFNQPFSPVRRTCPATFNRPLVWQRKAMTPAQRRVFVCPWSDFFHDEVMLNVSHAAVCIVSQCDNLKFIAPTKRPENISTRLGVRWPGNLFILVSVENQETANIRIPRLIYQSNLWRSENIGLSCEPLLGPIKLQNEWLEKLKWVIIGGESGPCKDVRRMDDLWPADLLDQCEAANVPVWFKQWGSAYHFGGLNHIYGREYHQLPEALK